MNGRDRVLTSLNHNEPDRIPFDLGGMAQSGIHHIAYRKLRDYLDLRKQQTQLLNIITQAARLDDDFIDRLLIDTGIVYGKWADPNGVRPLEKDNYFTFLNEWGVEFRMPKENGYYYDLCKHPLDGDEPEKMLESYRWPDAVDASRFDGLKDEARAVNAKGKLGVLMGLCPGIYEMSTWLRGYENFFTDLATESARAERLLDKMAELKSAYWVRALEEVGELVDVINEADDLASQESLLISPSMYRTLIKPYHRKLFANIKKAAPHVKILFHSCGAMRAIIPDLIEIGVDILNPIQIGAKGMDLRGLKRDFGKDICFWGGGIDTQKVLERGSPEEIRDHVRGNIDALAPGGGYIFSTTHIIQPLVPPQNIMVMWETLQEYG